MTNSHFALIKKSLTLNLVYLGQNSCCQRNLILCFVYRGSLSFTRHVDRKMKINNPGMQLSTSQLGKAVPIQELPLFLMIWLE